MLCSSFVLMLVSFVVKFVVWLFAFRLLFSACRFVYLFELVLLLVFYCVAF